MALDDAYRKLEWERAQFYGWGDAMIAYTIAKTGFVTMPDATIEDFNPYAALEVRWPQAASREFMREVKKMRVPRWLLGMVPIDEIKRAAGEN